MGKVHKQYSPSFKAKVALEAIREEETVAELARGIRFIPLKIKRWKKTAIEGLTQLFQDGRQGQDKEKNLLIEELIGKLDN